MQISDIDHTSSHTLMLLSTYLATNSPEWWLYEIKIYLLCGFHKFLHAAPQGVALSLQGEHRVDMAPKKEHLYNFWSSNSQKWGTFLLIFLAFDLSSSKISSLRYSTMESIQLGPTLIWWTWTACPLTSMGLQKSSIRITWGRFYAEEVASVARESACVFPLLGTCKRVKDSNPDCRCLTWLKYPCILSSLAYSSPFTWPMTNLEFENIFTTFLPILWTMDIPSNKASYSA